MRVINGVEYYSTSELASRLGLSEATLRLYSSASRGRRYYNWIATKAENGYTLAWRAANESERINHEK